MLCDKQKGLDSENILRHHLKQWTLDNVVETLSYADVSFRESTTLIYNCFIQIILFYYANNLAN